MSQSKSEQTQNIPGKSNIPLSLQTRLVLFVLFISLVPLIIIAVRDIIQTQQALTNSAEISLKSNADQMAGSLDTFIQTTLDSIRIESQFTDFAAYLSLPPLQRSGSAERVRTQDLLNKLSGKDRVNILSYALVDTDGNVLLDSANQNTRKNEAEQAYFPQVQFANGPIVTAVTYINETTTIITFANRILNINGEYIGVLRVEYKSNTLQSIVKNTGGVADTLVLLLDQYYIRLADSQNPSLIQNSITPLTLDDYLLAVDSKRFPNIPREEQATNFVDFAYALDNAEEQPFFRVDITPNIPGDDTVAVAFMKTQPWVIAYSRPTSIFLADVQKQTRTNIILVIAASILITIIATAVARSLTNPIISLTKTANSISQGDLSARAEVNTTDEIGSLASAFNSMTDQLQATLTELEERIFNRTADLQKSNLKLETVAELARDIATYRDLDTLLSVTVDLIRERFNFYHAGIFLNDDRNEYAVLRAASGIAGKKMLESRHKLKIGETGIVGYVTSTGQPRIALDVGMDAVHFQNPMLPDTRSEIALPLRSRNVTIGALDIQSREPNAFNDETIKIFLLLADQLVAAIGNAQLVQQVDATLQELDTAYRTQTQQAWQHTIQARGSIAYEYDGAQIKAVSHEISSKDLKQLQSGKAIVTTTGHSENDLDHGQAGSTLLVPLKILNQVIGVVGLEQDDPNYKWTEEDIAVVEAAARRAALSLENARLLEDAQRRASKERIIGEISTKIGSVVNIDNIIETAVRELGRTMPGAEIAIQFQKETD